MKGKTPLVVHMVEAFEKVGGPPKLVKQIISSEIICKYDFQVVSYEISGFSLKSIFYLRDKLKGIKPDIVHVHGLKNDGFHAVLAARLAKVPKIILTVHGTTADSINEYNTFLKRIKKWIIEYVLEPVTLRLASSVYCVCDAMKNRSRIQHHTKQNIYGTIYNGVQINDTTYNIEQLRASFKYESDDIVIIYTGRISIDKGIYVLVDAFENLLKKDEINSINLKFKLLIVGNGPEFENLTIRCEKLKSQGLVNLTGKRDDIDDLLSIADIFVLPTFHENLSFSLLEAMGSGLPAIVTAVGGNIEVVNNNGINGIVIPPNNIEALTDALNELVQNTERRKNMGFDAKKRIKTSFSIKQVIEKTDRLYEKILKK